MTSASELQPSRHSRPLPRGIIFILAIGSPIRAIFESKSRDFGDFRHVFNVFINPFKLESRCDFDRDVSSSHATDTIDTVHVTQTQSFNFDSTGVGLSEFNTLECGLIAVLTATTTATGITNENKNKMKYKCESNEPLLNKQAKAQRRHSTAPAIDQSNKIDPNSVESRKFDNVEGIFNGKMNQIGLQYDMFSGVYFYFHFIFTLF